MPNATDATRQRDAVGTCLVTLQASTAFGRRCPCGAFTVCKRLESVIGSATRAWITWQQSSALWAATFHAQAMRGKER